MITSYVLFQHNGLPAIVDLNDEGRSVYETGNVYITMRRVHVTNVAVRKK